MKRRCRHNELLCEPDEICRILPSRLVLFPRQCVRNHLLIILAESNDQATEEWEDVDEKQSREKIANTLRSLRRRQLLSAEGEEGSSHTGRDEGDEKKGDSP